MKTKVYTSGILVRNGKILIIKRNYDAPRFANMWDTVGGHLKSDEFAEECMLREAKEEIGLKVRIKKAGKVLEFNDKYGRSVSIPFLIESDSDKVKLNYEHRDYKWVYPNEIKNYNCVPDIIKIAKLFGLV